MYVIFDSFDLENTLIYIYFLLKLYLQYIICPNFCRLVTKYFLFSDLLIFISFFYKLLISDLYNLISCVEVKNLTFLTLYLPLIRNQQQQVIVVHGTLFTDFTFFFLQEPGQHLLQYKHLFFFYSTLKRWTLDQFICAGQQCWG